MTQPMEGPSVSPALLHPASDAASAAAQDNRFIYLAGGYQDSEKGFVDAAFIYDIREDRYAPATRLPYRANVGLVQAGGHVYCLGGEDKLRHRTASCYRIKVEDLRPLSR